MMRYMPSLENVSLFDFCSAMLHDFARFLECILPMPSVLAVSGDIHRFLGPTMAH